MGRKKRERITCMICQKPDMHNFSGGMCRGCYFKQQPGKDEGAQTRKTKTCKCGNALADSNKTGLCMSCAIKKGLSEKKSRIESSKKAPANPADLTASGIDEASQQDKKPSSFEKTEPAEVCDHDIGTLTTQGNPLYPSSTQVIQKYKGYEHREGDKFRLFKFCPECGAKLNIEAKTTAVKFLTTFYEVENQEKVNA
ncbi:MAG: hypothetical protein PHV05_06430 [Candidatus Riflebacteria bacterium]|nr:hypothetical protein [Candidatus Riflebacteria bacterium]